MKKASYAIFIVFVALIFCAGFVLGSHSGANKGLADISNVFGRQASSSQASTTSPTIQVIEGASETFDSVPSTTAAAIISHYLNTTPVQSPAATPTSSHSSSVPVASTSVASTTIPTATAVSSPLANVSVTLPYSIGIFGNNFDSTDGWANWWGYTSQNSDGLVVGSTASSTGGGALFSESPSWTDYTFTANIDWLKGNSFGLVARYLGDRNYMICDFGESQVGAVYMNLRQFVDGTQVNLASGVVPNYEEMYGRNISVAIQVEGNQAACAFNGRIISTTYASTKVSPVQNGEIGFSTWDPSVNNSEIIVHSVGVVIQPIELFNSSYGSTE